MTDQGFLQQIFLKKENTEQLGWYHFFLTGMVLAVPMFLSDIYHYPPFETAFLLMLACFACLGCMGIMKTHSLAEQAILNCGYTFALFLLQIYLGRDIEIILKAPLIFGLLMSIISFGGFSLCRLLRHSVRDYL
jgi:hypothetical protein